MGPVTTLPLEKAAQIDLRQAARYFGEPGEPDDATLALLARVAPPVLAAAMPRAVWRRQNWLPPDFCRGRTYRPTSPAVTGRCCWR